MEQENVDPIYKKGFEHGYWLQRGDSPELKKVIEGSANHANYSNGLKAGSREAAKEKFKEQMTHAREGQSKTRDKDRE